MDFYCLLTGLAALASIFVMRITFQLPYFRAISVGEDSDRSHQMLNVDVSTSLSNCLIDWVEVPGYRLYPCAPNAGVFYLPARPTFKKRLPLNFISSPDRSTLSLRLILDPEAPLAKQPIKVRVHWCWSFLSWTRETTVA